MIGIWIENLFDEKLQKSFFKTINPDPAFNDLVVRIRIGNKTEWYFLWSRTPSIFGIYIFTRSGSWKRQGSGSEKNFLRVAVLKDTVTFKVHSIRISHIRGRNITVVRSKLNILIIRFSWRHAAVSLYRLHSFSKWNSHVNCDMTGDMSLFCIQRRA